MFQHLREQAHASRDASASWIADFQRAVDLATSDIADDPEYRVRWNIEHPSASAENPEARELAFDPMTYLRLRHLAGASEELDRRLQDAFSEVFLPLLAKAGAATDPASLELLAQFALT